MNDVNDGGFAVDCEASDVHHYVAKQSSSTYTEVLDVMWRLIYWHLKAAAAIY